jgi:short-subunit dehydrogenase involved in D-alanine esterification of teichoic acids
MKLHSRNILITGGSSGIGLELARALAVDNSVLIAGRNRARLEHAVSAEPRLRPIELDVTSEGPAQGLTGDPMEKRQKERPRA